MDRLLRVSNAWNWLPSFRVVAEYESIQQAAVVLSVSASALSRTVRLLEDAVGEHLFVRSATGLTLTPFGAELLKGTRDAMRRIDDVLAAGRDPLRSGVFTAGAGGAVLPRLVDISLARVLKADASIAYRTLFIDEEEVVTELLRGNVDVALIEGGSTFDPPPEITAVAVGEIELALMAPARDPGADAPVVIVARCPAPPDRRVAAVASSLEGAERLATEGPFLALLPRGLASESFRIVSPTSTRISVVAVFRTPLEKAESSHVRAVVAALRTQLAPKT